MSDDVSREASSSSQESDEQTFEINVKTLENQVHKVRVTKDMPVAVLKEKLVDITRVPVEQQRLIFRGRVLKDDQPLSEFHVEDGHTLHMVARQPTDSQSTPGSTSADGNRNTGNDSSANGQRTRPGQGPRNVIFGVNISETGEEMTDQIVRGVGEMLRSLGAGLMTPGGGAGNTPPSANAGSGPEQEGSQNTNDRAQPVNPVQPGFAVLNHQIQVSPMPPGALIPRNMVIPDSVTTLSDFIHRVEVALQSSGSQNGGSDGTLPQPLTRPEAVPLNQRGIPTPQALASVIAQARQLLIGRFASSLSHFAQSLERDVQSTDSAVRQAIQSEAIQAGILMQHLGAMLLELGRTTMTLRMGSSPEESVVNSGPSVYLNANGPNPIMVQPCPLQTSSLFGSGQIIGGVVGSFSGTTGAAVPPTGATSNETPVDPNAAQPTQLTGTMRARSLSRQDASLIRSGTENQVDQGSSDHVGSISNSVSSTSAETMQSPKSGQGSQTDVPAPLGLGLAGLQPKRKVKAAKPTGEGSSQPPALTNPMPQLDFQSLLSQISRSNPNPMQSTAAQSQAPPQRADLGSMLSQMLQSPAINNLLTNMATQSGMGSPSELKSVMEQCTQDPAMQDIFGDLVQQIDRQRGSGVGLGGPTVGGGIDLSRIVQQMMPVVSNALGGGSGQLTGGSSPSIPSPSPSAGAGHGSEASLQQACERIEQHDSASNIFTSVMEGTSLYRSADADFTDLINDLSTNSDLANDYMNLLYEEIRKRLQSISGTGNRL